MVRQSWDEYFSLLARQASERATCNRLKVGCVIVDRNHNVISTGYNGSLPGEPHCVDVGCDDSSGRCLRTIHAEDNAISRAPRFKRCGSTLYVTHFPCRKCATTIAHSGIAEVVYTVSYRVSEEALQLFNEHCIVFRKFTPQEY